MKNLKEKQRKRKMDFKKGAQNMIEFGPFFGWRASMFGALAQKKTLKKKQKEVGEN